MSHTVKLATHTRELQLEAVCKTFAEYTKHFINGNYYYTLSNVDWDENNSQATQDIAEFLSRLPEEEFAFIRIGEDFRDVQINGSPEAFGIDISLVVSY